MSPNTIVYVDDDGIPSCFGTFTTREHAEIQRLKMDAELEADRDAGGRGAGKLFVCAIEPLRRWDEA